MVCLAPACGLLTSNVLWRSSADTGTGGLEKVVAKFDVLRLSELMMDDSGPALPVEDCVAPVFDDQDLSGEEELYSLLAEVSLDHVEDQEEGWDGTLAAVGYASS